jgi:hypothetical protein
VRVRQPLPQLTRAAALSAEAADECRGITFPLVEPLLVEGQPDGARERVGGGARAREPDVDGLGRACLALSACRA